MISKRMLLAAAGAILCTAVVAGPLKVKTAGKTAQTVVMCPDCSAKLTCAKVGDYTIGLSAELDTPKTGAGKVVVHVKDKSGAPVTDAKVSVTLSMPAHGHAKAPLALKTSGHGMYAAATQLVMPGPWQADVEVTPASGDTIKQAFTFSR